MSCTSVTITTRDLAVLLSIKLDSAERLVRRHGLGVKVGGRWRLDAGRVATILQARTAATLPAGQRDWVSCRELAELVGVDRETARLWAATYDIGERVNGRWRIDREKARRFLDGERVRRSSSGRGVLQ